MMYLDVDTAITVPVNTVPLIDDSDFKTRETGVAYNAAGMDLVWNFVTPGGVITQTAVTPTTAGDYDWTHIGDGMYKIEIPASGGASINNDTEGYGYFTGLVTGVLPFRGPTIGFRAAGLNDALVESAYSTTRGLAGTALPAAAADAAGGLPISDAGGLDLDSVKSDTAAILVDTAELQTDWANGGRLDMLLDGVKAKTDELSFDGGDVVATLSGETVALSASGLDNITAWTVDITGNVSGSVGSVTGGINTAAGTITTLDGLDTAQDTQHATTQGKVDTAQVDLDTITDTGVVATNMRGTDSAYTGTPPAASAIADAVWDEVQTGHTTAGTFGKYLDSEVSGAGGGGGGDATAANQAILLARTASGVTVNATNQANANSDFANPIRRGDEYSAAAGNAFTITATGYPNSPWGSSTTAALKINQNGVWTTTGTVAVAHDADETVTLTITFTETETAALTANAVTTYEVELTNGTIQRSIAGKWAVEDSDE